MILIHKNKFIIFLSAILLITSIGCANRQMTGESLLLDDFNDAIDPNELGGFSYIYAHKGARIEAGYHLLESDESSLYNYCLEISWQTPIASDAGWGFNTRVLDVTIANYLKLSLKPKSDINGVQLAIKDMNGKEVKQPLSRYAKNDRDWQNVVIPLSDYKGLDFTRIKAITLIFSPHTPEGSLLIDDIEFRK